MGTCTHLDQGSVLHLTVHLCALNKWSLTFDPLWFSSTTQDQRPIRFWVSFYCTSTEMCVSTCRDISWIYIYIYCDISVSVYQFPFVTRGSLTAVVPYCPLAAAPPDCCRNLNVQFPGCWVSWKLWCCFCWFIQVSKSKTKVVPFRNLFSPVISNNRSNCRTSMSAKAAQRKLLIIILSLEVERVKKI